MRIVLIGDLHFYKLLVWPWQLFSKRFLGQMNLWVNRRFVFKLGRMVAVSERVNALKPDMVLLSGDLTTTALPSEFRLARAVLAPLLEAYGGVVVPGNHDRHTFSAARQRVLERFFPVHAPSSYPHHRHLRDNLHLLALDPTRPNIATDRGRLGARQLREVAGVLAKLPGDVRLIVLCHYTLGLPPSLAPESPRHVMADAAELLELLKGSRDTLYLHGHVHTPFCWRVADAPNVLAVNAGAPLMHDDQWPNGQGFWEIESDAGEGGTWRLTHHSHDADGQWHAEPVGLPSQPGGAVTFT